MSRFVFIDPAKLPQPSIVEALDYETIYAAIKADVLARRPDMADVLALETDPAAIILQALTYRELLVRGHLNDAVKSLFPSTATGSDLDLHGARFGVARKVLVEGDPNADPATDDVLETDEDFRRRIALALEAFSTAGPEGAYIYAALQAHADVKDVSIDSPTFTLATLDGTTQGAVDAAGAFALEADHAAGLTDPRPGDVVVTILSIVGDGVPAAGVLTAVEAALDDEDVRPLTDRVTVRAATITTYTIEAELTLYYGPDAELVRAAAETAAQAYADENHKLGHDITLSGLYAALHQPGVQNVNLISPAADIVCGDVEAAYCTSLTVTEVGRDV